MKFVIVILFIIFFFLNFEIIYVGRCLGNEYCIVCLLCNYCKNCVENGGICGVCFSYDEFELELEVEEMCLFLVLVMREEIFLEDKEVFY